VPIDNNWVENQIRPWALGRSNWLFAGSLRSGQRAAAIMSLIQSAKLNGHDPYAYLKDVLRRLPTQKNNAIEELLLHNWKPVTVGKTYSPDAYLEDNAVEVDIRGGALDGRLHQVSMCL